MMGAITYIKKGSFVAAFANYLLDFKRGPVPVVLFDRIERRSPEELAALKERKRRRAVCR